jgi:hypothetical protein
MKIAPRFASQSRLSVAAVLVATVSLFVGSAAAVAAFLPLS